MSMEGSFKKEEKMTIKNKCLDCGKCCIVCSDVYLTKEEVASGEYKYQKRNTKEKLNGWSGKILKRKKAFIKELNKEVFMCYYFDPIKRLCMIYEKRPVVCRGFDCSVPEYSGEKIHKIYDDVLNGKANPSTFFEEG